MTAVEQIDAEVARLAEILRVRGQFWEDEAAAYAAYQNCATWLKQEKDETARIEREAAEAEEAEKLRDPHAETKDLFNTYRKKLKQQDGRYTK